MDAEKKPENASAPANAGDKPAPTTETAPDALEKPDGSETVDATSPGTGAAAGDTKSAKQGLLQKLRKVFNLYVLLFLLVVVVGGAVAVVAYLNGKKPPKTPTIANQTLTPAQLQQLSNSNASVGNTGQTLTIQGNAVVDGQTLLRGNLNVAGTIQLGTQLSVPNLTVSGTANLANTQIQSLQVANAMTIQGLVTLQNGLNVSGAVSFGGPVTAGQITVTKLIMSGNAQLQIPNHIAFTGPTPSRVIHSGPLGAGGSASIDGSDTSGTLDVNTGNGPQPGCFVDITFSQKYTGTPRVIVTPVGAAAGQTQFYVTRTATGFSVCTDNAAPANAELAYDYFVMD